MVGNGNDDVALFCFAGGGLCVTAASIAGLDEVASVDSCLRWLAGLRRCSCLCWLAFRGLAAATTDSTYRRTDSRKNKRADLVARRGPATIVEALCFGDFHLGQQMKVTRLPGRDPAWFK